MIPLGGLGEIGKNMMVLECGDDMLIIDAGLMFPTNEMHGIDIVIPDAEYVFERLDSCARASSLPTDMKTTSALCPT